MTRSNHFRPALALRSAYLGLALLAAACGKDSSSTGMNPEPGGPNINVPQVSDPKQVDFTTEDQNGPSQGARFGGQPGSAEAGGTPTAAPGKAADNAGAAPPATPSPQAPKDAPAGRTADVEEGDIYKVVGNRLYYLSTYKGFVAYDLTDPKKPARLSRLPVFGYPVEMFVEGNTIYALLRDALYLTQIDGKVQFARHNVSQLVTIDITDIAKPRVVKALDIEGQLREGVSRKIENTIYVVSYFNAGYWWGWSYENPQQIQNDRAFVYSFNVANPADPKKVGELKVFDGGAVNFYDKKTGSSYNRNFSGVSISATSNALMVVENWYVYASGNTSNRCGYYSSDQQAVVSIFDISDPAGAISLHTTFETRGYLGDQFKQTYVHDDVTGKGTYFGIFARNAWGGANCSGTSFIQNTIESWDVSNGANPQRLHALDFGDANETVRGSAFDPSRQVAYAITARQIDPLYAFDISNPAKIGIHSAIKGLSGDVTVFRLVGDKKFLLAVGRDNSTSCTGFDDTMGTGTRMNNIAVSLFDAQNLKELKLVQRQCVKVDNAAWVSSAVTWDLDQAHKMLGMHADGNLNVVTVPVSYYKHNENNDWWWDHYETAVGIMSWDLTRYVPGKLPAAQNVITNHGTFLHPEGEVRRSVLYSDTNNKQRMMVNLSDTHVSVANLQDLDKPKLESIVEIAPYLHELFRFGDHIVEQVQPRTSGSWDGSRSVVEFRVKAAGGSIEEKAPVATFTVGQVQRAVKHGDQLVVFRYSPELYDYGDFTGKAVLKRAAKSEAVVFDLKDPTAPRLVGRKDLPIEYFPYYNFFCGTYWSGFWFGDYYGGYYGNTSWTDTAAGLLMTRRTYSTDGKTSSQKLMFLDLRTPSAPKLTEKTVDMPKDAYVTGLTVDPVDARGFYLGYRTYVEQVKKDDGSVFHHWKDYAARWELDGSSWVQRSALNVPGRLTSTFLAADGQRMLMTADFVAQWLAPVMTGDKVTTPGRYVSWTRVSLLREVLYNGRRVAELLDGRTFKDLQMTSLVADGTTLFVNGQPGGIYYYGGGVAGTGRGGVAVDAPPSAGVAAPAKEPEDKSDRLMIFDLSQKTLNQVFEQKTKMFNVSLMGAQHNRLFANLAGDGIMVLDVSNPAAPRPARFERTLGYATHIDIAGDDVYVASGFFGTTHLDLRMATMFE